MSNNRTPPPSESADTLRRADAACREGMSAAGADLLDDAFEHLKLALSLVPPHAQARETLKSIRADLEAKAAAMDLQQRGEIAAARHAYETLLARRPRYAEVLNNLGVLLLQGGDVAAATERLRQATIAKPSLASAHSNLGAALKRQGRFEDAIASYREAIRIAPGAANAHYNLGHALAELQRKEEAAAAYEAALEHDPRHTGARASLIHQRRHLCDWRHYEQDIADLRTLIESDEADVAPFDALISFDDPALQLRCARRRAAQASLGVTPLPPREPRSGGRLRLGYISSDFRAHPVAWLISEVIELHDRAHFEVFGYSHGPDDGSAERRRLQHAFDHWVDLRDSSDDQAARRIRDDGIDILIDLNGHTLGARTGILARRPASIQVNWLGYPGTMGADYIDYVIGDDFATPPDLEPFFTERIIRLPHCFQPNDTTKRAAERTPTRAELGLPENAFVFCCFNNPYKYTPEMFGVWMRLLRAVPGSVLWLLETSEACRSNLLREAASAGIEPERLVFAPRIPLQQYLARYGAADLFLDTSPYNAGTTASDALLAGLPVVSLTGQCFAGRMAGSILVRSGLSGLVALSPENYESTAIALVFDDSAPQLKSLARKEPPKSIPAISRLFARDLEVALLAIVQ